MTINVCVVEDVDEIRESLEVLINGSSGYRCIGGYSCAEDALESIRRKKPDIVLMDINLPKMSGIDCVGRLKAMDPNIQIIMLTVYEDSEQVFKALKAGASGYLLKRTPPAKILEAIQEVREGGSPMSMQIARMVVESFQHTVASTKGSHCLTDREEEILSYLVRGDRYKEIADALFISLDTVRTHVRRIYEKLQIHSRTEAVLKNYRK